MREEVHRRTVSVRGLKNWEACNQLAYADGYEGKDDLRL